MPNHNPPDPRPGFLLELQDIREDPEVKQLALRRARNRELAEDALQEAYWAVARVADPAAIRDLRAYFRQVLIREVYHLTGQLGATVVEDLTGLLDTRQSKADNRADAPRPVFDTVCTNLLAKKALTCVTRQRARLTSEVPGRSPDPDRYRAVIVTVAERVIRTIIIGDVSNADHNAALRTAYPEWFAERGRTEETYHQRFSRARADVRTLLKQMISRDDLRSLAHVTARYFRHSVPSCWQAAVWALAEVYRTIVNTYCRGR